MEHAPKEPVIQYSDPNNNVPASHADFRTSEFFISLGKTLSEQGKLADAIRAYNDAIEIDPNNNIAFLKLGYA